jgi:hypothetical protein
MDRNACREPDLRGVSLAPDPAPSRRPLLDTFRVLDCGPPGHSRPVAGDQAGGGRRNMLWSAYLLAAPPGRSCCPTPYRSGMTGQRERNAEFPGNRLRPLHMPGHLRTVNRACASWKFAAAASRSPRGPRPGRASPTRGTPADQARCHRHRGAVGGGPAAGRCGAPGSADSAGSGHPAG